MNNAGDPAELVDQIRLMNRVHTALSSSLKREDVHTLILATLTTPRGLNFQRAFLFLYNRGKRLLTGHLAMGPADAESARLFRAEMEAEAAALHQIVASLGEGDSSSDPEAGPRPFRDTLRGLQHSAYWITMLQQYQPNNPLTRSIRTIEHGPEPPAHFPGDPALPRIYNYVDAPEPMLLDKRQVRLSDTLRELLADQFALLPLHTSQGPVGLAVLDNRYADDESITPADIERLGWFSAQTSLALENAELFSDLQRAYDGLKEVDKLKSNFLSTISHELRTPLTAINGFLHLLIQGKMGVMQPGQVDLLKRIQNHGQHLTNIVNDLIEVAEVRSGGLEDVELETVDPLICLMNTLPKLEPRRQGRSVSIEPHLDLVERVPYVRANTRLLERVYYHLIDNSIKFVPEKTGRVDVKFREQGDRVYIDIVDNGIGISPDRLKNIFDGFYQVDNRLARSYNGLGIGLSVTKMLLDTLHATIHVESRVGEGSTFTIGFAKANETIDGPPRDT